MTPKKVRYPEHAKAFLQEVISYEHPDWEADIHRHTAGLQHMLRTSARHNFRKQRIVKRTAAMTDTVFKQVIVKKQFKKAFQRILRSFSRRLIMYIWQAWANSATPTSAVTEDNMMMVTADATMAQVIYVYIVYKSQVRLTNRATRRDVNRRAKLVAKQMETDALAGRARATWAGICFFRAAKPRKRVRPRLKPLRYLLDNGEPYGNFGQIQQARQKFHGDKELAVIMNPMQHMQAIAATHNLQAPANPCPSLIEILTSVETEIEVLQQFARKALGPDQLGADICRIHPAIMAKAIYTIVLKAALRLQVPFSLKGGQNTEMPKDQGGAALEANRAILLEDVLGKILRRPHRNRLHDTTQKALAETQLGGRKNK